MPSLQLIAMNFSGPGKSSMMPEGLLSLRPTICQPANLCFSVTVEDPVRVAGRDIALYELYIAVVKRGGYDAVCDGDRGWRNIITRYNMSQTAAAANAYGLKKAYYKNLVYALSRTRLEIES